MSPGQPALIGHVEITDLERWPEILHNIKAMLLKARHRPHHLQAEVAHDPFLICTRHDADAQPGMVLLLLAAA
jgi:hypothetical protein